VHASIGIAAGSLETHTPDDLLRDADLAMNFAKRKGRDRFEVFHQGLHDQAAHRLEVAAELVGGLQRGEFVLFYQPIVDIFNGRTVGVEALVRWQHPRRGLLGPDEFVPVAESTGSIALLDRWVFDEACRQTKGWMDAGVAGASFYVSVNLSARHLQDVDVAIDIREVLAISGLEASALVVEITETALIGDVDSATVVLAELKSLGLRIAVDDFGTGYSSLSRLVRFPLDIIKIDKSFVDQIVSSVDGNVMVRTVVDLAHTLGLRAIAEGVERPEQAQALRDLNCHLAQGYLFSEPVSADDMRRRLAAQLADR
jgi:EAL domain-containing protein (putative c-di-GMP-specific phosphodiesterase class I)